MDSNMAETNVTGLEEAYQSAEHQAPGQITETKESYYHALDTVVDRASLSDAILNFCGGHRLQLLEKTTKEDIEASTTTKTRNRRDLFDRFSAYAKKRLNSIKSRLGGGVSTATFGGHPPPPPPRNLGVAVQIDNAYDPHDPYLGGGHKDPYTPVHSGPKDPYKGDGHVDPYDPHHGGYPPKSGGPCFEQSACKVKEGCTVKTERTCADYGWFFGNRGGIGRRRYLSDPKCLRWRYADVKDCVNVNKCEKICT
ncbi:uncharacterized protein LOC106179389 [Lingula anatina]|uniref:Uncharacterized protein LOC106179389 n=1 Tax=Lingula anatina TaxID=7574 RepID=A0A1S3K7I5_LINAN|nr:uncharacterized protein LOC106179389 [Lingula anatina]|eukprot:XP_013418457.1 uncharacterized protein LOC106179389 [Lingula anatina]